MTADSVTVVRILSRDFKFNTVFFSVCIIINFESANNFWVGKSEKLFYKFRPDTKPKCATHSKKVNEQSFYRTRVYSLIYLVLFAHFWA